jgi:hypothetical protein
MVIKMNKRQHLKRFDEESVITMLLSQEVLRKEWDNKADERWNEL